MHSRYQVSSVKEPRKCYGRFLQGTVVVPKERRDMKRVVVDHYGGPEVLRVVEEDDPRPGPGEVCVRVLAAGVSFTDALLRAGTYLGGPKPPFTPGYELVGAVAIDYRNEDFLARVRGLPGKGVDVVLDGLGGALSVRSFRALRPGGRLVVFGYSSALTQGRRSRRAWIKWNAQTASVFLWGLLSPRRRVSGYRIDKLRNRRPEWFREDFLALLELLRRGEIHPVVAERLPLTEARRAHELLESSAATGSSCSCHNQ